jgi:hypothetical protein
MTRGSAIRIDEARHYGAGAGCCEEGERWVLTISPKTMPAPHAEGLAESAGSRAQQGSPNP